MAHRRQARNIRLEAAVGLETIRVDRDLFQRVLENLVENAIRHAPRHSVVRIEDGRLAAEIEIRVADSGSGVPPDQRERIFDRFVQIDTPRSLFPVRVAGWVLPSASRPSRHTAAVSGSRMETLARCFA